MGLLLQEMNGLHKKGVEVCLYFVKLRYRALDENKFMEIHKFNF